MIPVHIWHLKVGGAPCILGSTTSKNSITSLGINSSKLQALHLNKTEFLLCFGMVIQPFKIGVFPSVVNSKIIFYFSRMAKKFDKFEFCSAVNTL